MITVTIYNDTTLILEKEVSSKQELIDYLNYIEAYDIIDYLYSADEDADWSNDVEINL